MREGLNDLLIFAEVARQRSLSAGAAALGLPKSTVSRRLQVLEQRVAGKLLIKTTRRVELTELGASLLGQCERVEQEVREVGALIDDFGAHPRGRLRMTMPVDCAMHWMPDVIRQYTRLCPDVQLELHCTARRVDLVAERFDIAIRFGKLEDSSIVSRRFVAVTRALYASPGYLHESGEPTGPTDLASHRFVLLDAHARAGAELALRRADDSRTVVMHGSVVSNSLGSLRHMAMAGIGLALVPVRMCVQAEQSGRLVRVLKDWQTQPWEGHYMIPARRLVPVKTRTMLDMLSRMASEERV